MANPMLSVNNVSAHYGKIQALHNVSLHISQGEIVTLIGANGAGKTTLLGTLCGAPPRAALPSMAKPLPTGKPRVSCARRSLSCRKGAGYFRA